MLLVLFDRFEMPYNIWCGGCGIHIGMGMFVIIKITLIGILARKYIAKIIANLRFNDQRFFLAFD